jgi:hypothetical protein
MTARAEWEHATQHARHLAVAADSEYRGCHPDAQHEPLRSAEPPLPTADQRRELGAARAARETPAWVAELAERNQAAREKLAERHGVIVPNEDPEWGRRRRDPARDADSNRTRSCSRPSPRSGRHPS